MPSEWNSLEVAKLAVAALVPLTLLGLGLIVARNTRRLDSYQHANQTVVARRHEIFQEVAPKLNQLLCFMALVGRWKEITPTDVLSLKRDVDEVMYTNCLLFSDTLFATYHAFMARFFAMYATIDGDALIRARIHPILATAGNFIGGVHPWSICSPEITSVNLARHSCPTASYRPHFAMTSTSPISRDRSHRSCETGKQSPIFKRIGRDQGRFPA